MSRVLRLLVPAAALICAALSGAPAQGDEWAYNQDGTRLWIAGSPTGAQLDGLTVDVQPPVGFRNTYVRIDGPVTPGAPGQGLGGLVRFADLGVREPAEQTPDVLLTYQQPDSAGQPATFVWVMNVYRNVEQGTQCGRAMRLGPFAGPVTLLPRTDTSPAMITSSDRGLPQAMGFNDDAGPATVIKLMADDRATAVFASEATAADLRNLPGAAQAVEAHAADTWNAYQTAAGADLAIRRARFASWYADEVLLGRSDQADQEFARQSHELAPETADTFRAQLAQIRQGWAVSPARTVEQVAASRNPPTSTTPSTPKAKTLASRFAFDAYLQRSNGRGLVAIVLRNSALAGHPAIVRFATRPGGHGPYTTMTKKITLQTGVVVNGPVLRGGTRARLNAWVSVPGFTSGALTVISGTRAARRVDVLPPLFSGTTDPLFN